MNFSFKKVFPYLISLIAILLVSIFHFYPQLEGKKIPQGDIISFLGMSQEIREFEEKHGEEMLWTNSMFGGMPSYQIKSNQPGNLTRYVFDAMRLFIDRPIGKFFMMSLCFFILLLTFRVNVWLSLIGSLLAGFCTNNLVLYEAGHITKLNSIATGALVLSGVLLLFREKYISGGAIFSLGLSLNLLTNHVQMTYYWAFVIGLFIIFKVAHFLKEQKWVELSKIAGIALIALLLAVGSNASKLWTTLEYSRDTMRGKPILEQKGEAKSSSETEGLEWSYAMQWSNGLLDVFANYIPAVVGGSSAEPVKESYEMYRIARQSGTDRFPYYWGPLPFTSGPAYYGALAMFLFLLTMFTLKSNLRWWALTSFILITLMSMGKNFELLNRLLFDYFPLYNKFRATNSAMSILAVLVPIFGVFGLNQFLNKKKYAQKDIQALLISGGILAGLSLIFAVFGPSLFDFSNQADQRYAQMGLDLDLLREDRRTMMRNDALRSMVFVGLTVALLWFYIKDKLNQVYLLASIGFLALIDIVPVGKRYLTPEDFVSERKYEANFEPRKVDEQIFQFEKKGRGYYRVFDQSINTYNSSKTSYFHNTIGGYHAAKLQRIQDVIDRYLSGNLNMDVVNMLNGKYFIFNREGQTQMQVNAEALGNAWLVEKLKVVQSANEEIDALANFDPGVTAIVHKEFSDQIQDNYSNLGDISLREYRPDRLVYDVNVLGSNALAVFSEIWYGPDKGWKSYIDGKEVEHFRSNYLLRALNVPKGHHEIIFEFNPRSYELGTIIGFISSGIILLFGCLALYIQFRPISEEKNKS